MFLLAGVWALVVPLVWLRPDLVADPVFWHWHELVFGMAGAAAGGYLLTALPHWTGHHTGALASGALAAAWLAGRAALVPGGWGLAAALAYPLTLAALLIGPVLTARAWRRLALAGVPLVMAAAEAALHGLRAGGGVPAGLPFALVLAVALLLGLIGGRIVPAFTFSRLGAETGPRRGGGALGLVAAAAVLVAMSGLAVPVAAPAAGPALIVAALAQGARLAGWQSRALAGHGDILMLHLAWLWLVLGLALAGLARLSPRHLDPATCLHVLTMGAMGTMIFAVAARPVMARAPGRLIAGRGLGLALGLISAAALLRLLPGQTLWGLAGPHWAALAWGAGWAVFVARALGGVRRPPPFPVLSARRTPPVRR